MDVVDLLAAREAALGAPQLREYCSLISRLLKLRGRGTPQKQAAYAVWRALRATGMKLDAAAFRTGMNLCVELGRIQEANNLMSAMRAAGHRPGFGAYHILIKYHARAGDMDSARRLFTQLRAYLHGQPPAISAYNTLMLGFVRLGDLTMARAVLDKARREGARPDAFSFSTYAAGLAEAGRLAEAEALLEEAAAEGLPPSGVVYGAVLDGCVRRNDWTRVERIMARMRSEGLQPSAVHYNMLIRGRTYSPGYGAAVAAATHAGPRAAVGATNGGAPATAGQVPRDERSGTERGDRVDGPSLRPPAAAASAGTGPVPAVAPVLQPAPSLGGRGSAAGMGAAAAAGGDASSNGADGGGAPPSAAFAGGAGSFDVDSLLAEMRASGLRPDAITYGTLVHGAVRAGSIPGALEVLSAMHVDGVAPDGAVFTSLMKLFRQQGKQAQALEFFSQLSASRTSAVDCWALICLAAIHASAGRLGEAAEAARRADALAAEQGKPPPPEATYALLQGYGQQRDLPAALLAFRRFLASGGRPHRKMCEFVYRLCLAQCDFGAAAQVLRAMRLMRGLQLREEMYMEQWQEAQRRCKARQDKEGRGGPGRSGGAARRGGNRTDGSGGSNGSGSGPAGVAGEQVPNAGAEKLKWWFGLPNKYYQSDWR